MKEQAELVWYLSQGITVFQRSTLGPMLDKLELESCTSRTCRKCKGSGIVDEPHDVPDPKDPVRTITVQFGAWCPRCRGTGVEPVRLSAEEQELVHGDDWCRSDHEGTRTQVPDETLVRFAHVSRLLAGLQLPIRRVIEAAYGDEGEELAKSLKGRAWAVTPLTRAGRELLAQERDRKTAAEVADPERPVWCLASLADLPKDKRHPERTKLLANASRQAEKLLAEAEAVWELMVGGLEDGEV